MNKKTNTKNHVLKNIIIHFVLGILFAHTYLSFPHTAWNPFKLKLQKVYKNSTLALPKGSSLLLKIWSSNVPGNIYFNGKQIVHSIYRNRKNTKEFYFKISEKDINPKDNIISFSDNNSYSVLFKNHLFVNNGIGIVFKDNLNFTSSIKSARMTTVSIIFLTLLFGLLYMYASQKLLSINITDEWFTYALSYAPYFFIIWILIFLGNTTFVILWFSSFKFFTVFIVYFAISQFFFCLGLAKKQLQYSFINLQKDFNGSNAINITDCNKQQSHTINRTKYHTQSVVKRAQSHRWIIWYISRPFGDKCFFWFLYLIIFSALSLVASLNVLTEFASNIAYLLLVIGVIDRIIRTQSVESKSG